MIWIPPLITVFLFAASAICGRRLTVLLDSMWANWFRLGLASICLALIALATTGPMFSSPAFPWFFVSGIVGFGLGDMALFLAYARLGSRLTLVLNLCLAPLFAAAGEVLWRGSKLAAPEVAAMAVVLVGVTIAMSARPGSRAGLIGRRGVGLLWAVVAGFGQGFGGVISLHAKDVAAWANAPAVAPMSQAFQRCLGGLLWVTVTTLAFFWVHRGAKPRVFLTDAPRGKISGWLVGAALFGPVIGVTFFQWSLGLIGNAAYVQAVISTTPIAIIPMAWKFEGDRPSRRSVLGSLIAIAGVVAICLLAKRA